MLQSGPAIGYSNPEYMDLRRAWKDLLVGLPPIDGRTITEELPDADDIVRFLYPVAGFFAVLGAFAILRMRRVR